MADPTPRRKLFRLSKLPPAFYTTTGLQRSVSTFPYSFPYPQPLTDTNTKNTKNTHSPMVLPSEKEGASSRHHQFERPDTVFPPKRLRPEAMLELAEALEVGERMHISWWMDGWMDG
jgi:hypothetical protein